MTLRRSFSLFNVGVCQAYALTARDLPVLQEFFYANPDYFISVYGIPPSGDEAQLLFYFRPAPEIRFADVYNIGFVDAAGGLVGMANVVTDFLSRHVWHINLFVVATALQGSGLARQIYQQLENWSKAGGALWLRLDVVSGNLKAERFWHKLGYQKVREMHHVQFAERSQTVNVLVKPLAAGQVEDYLQLVAHDRPRSATVSGMRSGDGRVARPD